MAKRNRSDTTIAAFATPSPDGWLIAGEREAEFDRWEDALAAKQSAEAASLNIKTMEKR